MSSPVGLPPTTREPAAVLAVIDNREHQNGPMLSVPNHGVQQSPEVWQILYEEVLDPVFHEDRRGNGGTSNNLSVQAIGEEHRSDMASSSSDATGLRS